MYPTLESCIGLGVTGIERLHCSSDGSIILVRSNARLLLSPMLSVTLPIKCAPQLHQIRQRRTTYSGFLHVSLCDHRPAGSLIIPSFCTRLGDRSAPPHLQHTSEIDQDTFQDRVIDRDRLVPQTSRCIVLKPCLSGGLRSYDRDMRMRKAVNRDSN